MPRTGVREEISGKKLTASVLLEKEGYGVILGQKKIDKRLMGSSTN